ncbi:MAG: biotin transporter BioY [Smithellaceae bacterium]|nr:biotin transporter BioY [Smithellaceae bacterium]
MSSEKTSLKGMIYASLFGTLTAVGAYIVIPLPLVPITGQTLFVNLAGLLLGGYWGALSQVVYILLGVMGLPVFDGGKAGLGVLFGPTGGYLIGFVLAAYAIGKLVPRSGDPGLAKLLLAMLIGIALVYIPGVLQLSFVAKLGLTKALMVGAVPFLIGDVIKIVLAALIYKKARAFVKVS